MPVKTTVTNTPKQFTDSQVSIVIVTFNSCDDVLACLGSLNKDVQSGLVETIVVDNGSTDGTPAKLATHFPEAKLLAQHENLGFARACNVGIRHSKSPYLMLLNPDTEVKPGAIETLYRALDSHSMWGIVGPRMVDQDNRAYSAARKFPTAWRLATETLGLLRIYPRSTLFNDYFYSGADPTSLDRVEQIEGSALMISPAARDAVGNLDERFFIFFEEVDWCKRVADAGFEIHVVQDAEVMHRGSTTMSKYFIFSRQVRAQSAMKYFFKHYGKSGLFNLRSVMLCALLSRFLLLLPLLLTGRSAHRMRFAATIAEWREFVRGIHE